jgi:hypothetical protein
MGIGVIGFPLLFLALAVLPLVERGSERSFFRRPLALGTFLLLLVLLVASLVSGLAPAPPDLGSGGGG